MTMFTEFDEYNIYNDIVSMKIALETKLPNFTLMIPRTKEMYNLWKQYRIPMNIQEEWYDISYSGNTSADGLIISKNKEILLNASKRITNNYGSIYCVLLLKNMLDVVPESVDDLIASNKVIMTKYYYYFPEIIQKIIWRGVIVADLLTNSIIRYKTLQSNDCPKKYSEQLLEFIKSAEIFRLIDYENGEFREDNSEFLENIEFLEAHQLCVAKYYSIDTLITSKYNKPMFGLDKLDILPYDVCKFLSLDAIREDILLKYADQSIIIEYMPIEIFAECCKIIYEKNISIRLRVCDATKYRRLFYMLSDDVLLMIINYVNLINVFDCLVPNDTTIIDKIIKLSGVGRLRTIIDMIFKYMPDSIVRYYLPKYGHMITEKIVKQSIQQNYDYVDKYKYIRQAHTYACEYILQKGMMKEIIPYVEQGLIIPSSTFIRFDLRNIDTIFEISRLGHPWHDGFARYVELSNYLFVLRTDLEIPEQYLFGRFRNIHNARRTFYKKMIWCRHENIYIDISIILQE